MIIQTIKLTKDEYVNQCFSFPFEEEIETRDWRQMEATSQIPTLFRSSNRMEVLAQVKNALALYPDFDFVYVWKGYIQRKKFFNPVLEKATYEEGLKKSKSKVSLLDKLGQWYFDEADINIKVMEHNLHEAIKCWIQSCAIQMSTNQRTDAHPFMMLEYIANLLKAKKEENALHIQNTLIQNIALDSSGEHKLFLHLGLYTSEKERKSIKKALKLLCKHYKVGK